MVISNIKIHEVNDKENLKAFVSVTFDSSFMVHGIRVVQGKKGLFVAMPNRKDKEGKFLDVAHPISKEFKNQLVEAILEEYNK